MSKTVASGCDFLGGTIGGLGEWDGLQVNPGGHAGTGNKPSPQPKLSGFRIQDAAEDLEEESGDPQRRDVVVDTAAKGENLGSLTDIEAVCIEYRVLMGKGDV